jgi:general secretion pathway protein B
MAAAPPPAPAPARPPAAANPSPAPAPAAANAGERVYATANELPADARGGLPRMAIGGSIYSPDPAARFLIINGQVFHEGDEVANGLSLRRIELKAAVFDYKGYRFRVAY